MDKGIFQIAEQIAQLNLKAYEVYLPLVEDICSRIVSEDELSHLLDHLLDFACDFIQVCDRIKGGIVWRKL